MAGPADRGKGLSPLRGPGQHTPAMARRTGMVLGKFLPPHLGHTYLVEAARRQVDALTVVVGTLAAEPIPGALRYAWMQELAHDCTVVHLTDENPQQPEEHPQFWDIWRESLLRVLPERPDVVFASEAYGERLAAELGARFVPIDPLRHIVPVSGTAVRDDPWACWAYLPPPVRAYYVQRVVVCGPESTGKSTLAARLAAHYDTLWVPEYARTLIEAQAGRLEAADLPVIARGQAASEDVLARRASRLLITDTDLSMTKVWSEALFGAVEPWIAEAARARPYALHLLCDVDVPWVPDVVRYLPDERQSFLARCEAELARCGRRVVRISGSWDARFEAAVRAIDAALPAGCTRARGRVSERGHGG